jgi:hypothetical protein
MATTTNYGWETADDTDLVKDGALAMRTLGSAIDTTTKALNPSTTLGDIEYRSATANTNTRLGIGSTGNVLTVAGGVPTWAAPSGGQTFVGCQLEKITTAQSTSNNTATAISFNNEIFDTDGFHDNSTNNTRITIPSGKGGKYLLIGQINYNPNATGLRIVKFHKNGSLFSLPVISASAAATDSTNVTASTIVAVSAGDYVELVAQQTSGGSLDIGVSTSGNGIGCLFSCTYLGA